MLFLLHPMNTSNWISCIFWNASQGAFAYWAVYHMVDTVQNHFSKKKSNSSTKIIKKNNQTKPLESEAYLDTLG